MRSRTTGSSSMTRAVIGPVGRGVDAPRQRAGSPAAGSGLLGPESRHVGGQPDGERRALARLALRPRWSRPSSRRTCCVMVRPRPVPPYLRAIEASACVKASKTRAHCSGVMPMPGVADAEGDPVPAVLARDLELDRAAGRELAGVAEQVEQRLAHLGQVGVHRRPRLARTGSRGVFAVLLHQRLDRGGDGLHHARRRRTSPGRGPSVPASIFERSRTSLIRPSRWWPAALIFLRSGTIVGLAAVLGLLDRASRCSR